MLDVPSGRICWSTMVPGTITLPPVAHCAPSYTSIASIVVLKRVVPKTAFPGRCVLFPLGITIPLLPSNVIKLPLMSVDVRVVSTILMLPIVVLPGKFVTPVKPM